ncbi:hypothetical protein MY10362_005939 [Beauveria mimosiformis]
MARKFRGFIAKSKDDGAVGRPENTQPTNQESQRDYNGLFRMVEAKEATTQEFPALVVLVHGIGGHWKDSWVFSDFNWIDSFLQADVEKADLAAEFWSFGYDSRTNTNSVANVKDVARDLLDRIHLHQPRGSIIFVAHSLGGLVVKQAINMAHVDNGRFGALLKSIEGCVFLGVPHGGADKVWWKTVPGRMVKVCTVGAKGNINFAKSIERSSDIWLDIAEEFAKYAQALQIHSFYELNQIYSVQMVDKASARTGLSNEVLHSTAADHVNMNKFRQGDHQRYQTIGGAIKELVQRANSKLLEEENSTETMKDRVLGALYFPEMDKREEDIRQIYGTTYSWALESLAQPGETASDNSPREPPPFLAWLKSNQTMFWRLKDALMEWADGKRLVLAGCFFYEQGTAIQKSREGMLRTILHQIFSTQRGLIPVVFSDFFGDDALPLTPWTWTQLRKALELTLNNLGDSKICIFADGLDEYRILDRINEYKKGDFTLQFGPSNSDDRWGLSKWIRDGHDEIASLFLNLGTRDNIKICLSSRELQAFEDHFQSFDRLRVHQHTDQDIARYCEGRLTNEAYNFEDIAEFSDIIIEKASGVFLWVRIVVDMLIEGKQDGNYKEELLATLNELPEDLGDLYMRIMKTIPQKYLNESKRLFQLVLRRDELKRYMDCFDIIALFLAEPGHRQVDSGQSLLAEEDGFCPQTWEELKPQWKKYERRMKSRCGGLLEGASYVEFMHQTAKEFISMEKCWDHIFKELPGFRSMAEVDLALLSGCVQRLKCRKEAVPESILQDWDDPYDIVEAKVSKRFPDLGSEAIAGVMLLAKRFESEFDAELLEPYKLLLDDFDETAQRLVQSCEENSPDSSTPDQATRQSSAAMK